MRQTYEMYGRLLLEHSKLPISRQKRVDRCARDMPEAICQPMRDIDANKNIGCSKRTVTSSSSRRAGT